MEKERNMKWKRQEIWKSSKRNSDRQWNGSPHGIIVEFDGVELVSGEMAFPVKVPD